MRTYYATPTPLENPAAWKKRRAARADAPTEVNGPAVVVDACTDEPLLVQVPLPAAIDLAEVRQVAELLPYHLQIRAGGLKTMSVTFGHQPALPQYQRPWCAPCIANVTDPDLATVIEAAGRQLETVYAEHHPELYAAHQAHAQAIAPEWRMGGGVFTQAIANRTTALGYHLDSGNFQGVWSVMLVLRKNSTGGRLVVPELGVSLECPDGYLLLFDGQRWLHGVSPITSPDTSQPFYRYSIVWYGLRAMARCGPMANELARGQAARDVAEAKRARLDSGQQVHTP